MAVECAYRSRSKVWSLRLIGTKLAVAGCLSLSVASPAQAVQSPAASPVKLSRLSLASIPQHNETLGSPNAPVRMLYFDDPQCPFCRIWHMQVLPALVRKYVKTGKLQIQWHGYAVIGPASVIGERFIAAAGLQNHLWDVLDDLMANQGEENSGWLNTSLLEQIGASIPGFNVPAAMADAVSPAIKHEIVTDVREGNRAGLVGVPYMQIGRRVGPLRQLEFSEYVPRDFERSINRLLRKR
jgi:protein-disulfide isomerase